MLHGAVLRLRSLAYRRGWLRTETLPVPVLVVGNWIIGGAGKTPTTLALLQMLQTLGLRMNGIGPYDLVAIATAVGRNASLNKLDLSCNPLCERFGEASTVLDGMQALMQALGTRFTIATPALVDGRLYVRTEKALYCLGRR